MLKAVDAQNHTLSLKLNAIDAQIDNLHLTRIIFKKLIAERNEAQIYDIWSINATNAQCRNLSLEPTDSLYHNE